MATSFDISPSRSAIRRSSSPICSIIDAMEPDTLITKATDGELEAATGMMWPLGSDFALH